MTADRKKQNPVEDIQIPFDRAAEAAILGNLMMGFERMTVCRKFSLTPEDFFIEGHRIIYRIMQTNQANHVEQFDPVSLCSYLKASGELDRVGGGATISELLDGIVRFYADSVFAGHIEAVKECSRRRKLMHQANNTLAEIADGERESVEIARDVRALAEEIYSDNAEPEVHRSQLIKEAAERLESRKDAPPRGIRSGFSELDFIIKGLQPGHLCIAAARPRVGKSTFAYSWMLHCIRRQQVPLLMSFEMSMEQIVDRLYMLGGSLDGTRFGTGDLTDSELERYVQVERLLEANPWFVRDREKANLQSVETVARDIRKREGLDFLIIDYLGLMSGRGDNRVAELSEITRGLKSLARDLEIPILCLAQLSRAIEARGNDKPRLSDLRESGSIEQDADQVIFITRDLESEADLTEATLIVEKNRHGRSGKALIEFDRRFGGFVQ